MASINNDLTFCAIGPASAVTQAMNSLPQSFWGNGNNSLAHASASGGEQAGARSRGGTGLRGGTPEQHAQAGHIGGEVAALKRKRGRKSNAQKLAETQAAA